MVFCAKIETIAHSAVLPYLLPLPLFLKFSGREVWKIGVVVVERNCVRRPTLLASPTTKTSQPPLQKMRARPPKRASVGAATSPTKNACEAA